MKTATKFITVMVIALAALLQAACQSSDTVDASAASSEANIISNITASAPVDCAGEPLTVVGMTPYQDPSGRWWLIGQVSNPGAEDVAFARLCISMEEPGQRVNEDWLLDTTIRSGETAPFRALISSPNVSAKTHFSVHAIASDRSMSNSLDNNQFGYRNFKYDHVQPILNNGGIQFTGKITNVGRFNVNNIRVVIAIFDKSNRLVGVADGNVPGMVEVDPLKPGSEVEFTASTSYLSGPMDHYEIAIVEGRSIEAVRGRQK